MVIRRADVGDRDPGLHPLPRDVGERGDEAGAGGGEAREAGALRQVSQDQDDRTLNNSYNGQIVMIIITIRINEETKC